MTHSIRPALAGLFVFLIFTANTVAGPAGSATFVIGKVTAEQSDGSIRQLARADVVNSGELIATHSGGRIQLRFNDGAMISLQPDTRFKIDEYRYEGRQDGNELSVFSLVRGSLRAITGLIGKKNQDSFKLKTSVATIGIRGTGFAADFFDDLSVRVTQGTVILFNSAGELLLNAGQSGFVADWNTLPQLQLEAAPQNGTGGVVPGPGGDEFSAGEGRDSHGDSDLIDMPEMPPEQAPVPPPPPPPPYP